MSNKGTMVSGNVIVDSKPSIFMDKLLLVDAASKIHKISSKYRRKLDRYNKRLELLKSPIFIEPIHYSGEKEYHGRYHKERYYDDKSDRILHRHIGIEVPSDFVPSGGFPSCPNNPLDGLECQIIGNNVILTSEMYDRFINIFVGLFVVPVKWK